jgi:hypothetical protein
MGRPIRLRGRSTSTMKKNKARSTDFFFNSPQSHFGGTLSLPSEIRAGRRAATGSEGGISRVRCALRRHCSALACAVSTPGQHRTREIPPSLERSESEGGKSNLSLGRPAAGLRLRRTPLTLATFDFGELKKKSVEREKEQEEEEEGFRSEACVSIAQDPTQVGPATPVEPKKQAKCGFDARAHPVAIMQHRLGGPTSLDPREMNSPQRFSELLSGCRAWRAYRRTRPADQRRHACGGHG